MTSKSSMLIIAVLAIHCADAILNPFKNTQVAAEEENFDSIVYTTELYPKIKEKVAIVDIVGSGEAELNGENGKLQQIAATKNRRYSNKIKENAGKQSDNFLGTDFKNPRMPREATDITELEKAKIINNNKNIQRGNSKARFRNNLLVVILSRLDFENFRYIDEFKSLEEQYCSSKFPQSCETFRNVNEDADFLHSYKSLSDRISEHALTVPNSNDKKILGYLYTATLGRIYNLEDHLESTLVEDITEYFKSVKHDIENLKDFKNESAKKDVANKYKEEYKTVVDKKINNAYYFISEEVLPEIDYIKRQIDDQIEILLTEVIELQNQTRKQNDELRVQRNKLKLAVLSEVFLGPLKILAQALRFIGHSEKIARLVIEFGSSSSETFTLDIYNTHNIVQNLEQSVANLNSLKDEISKFSDLKVSRLKKTLEIVYEEIEKHPEELAAISDKVSDIKSKANAMVKNEINIKEVQGLEIELKTILQIQKNETMKADEDANNQKNKNAMAVIDNLLISVQLSSVTEDTLKKYKESPRKRFEIRKVLKKNKKNVDFFKEYEDKIYITMLLLLENIKKDVDDIISKLDSQDKVVFDVNKWKIKNTLKDLLFQLEHVTEDFKLEDNLKYYITKLQDAMFDLNIAQDYIQDYQKHKTLANFIAGVSSVSANDVYVSYGTFIQADVKDALRDLEITIRANIVKQRYNVAIDAFKLFKFPYVHEFLIRPLPAYLELHNTKLDSIVNRAISHFEQIKSQLEEDKYTRRKYKHCLLRTKGFDPFFTWEQKTNQYMFSKLLSGKEVIVKAHLTEPLYRCYTIKFGYVQFFINTENEDAQLKLNNILKGAFIEADHLGDSYYEYENKTYLITDVVNLFVYHSFRKRTNGIASASNYHFEMFMNRDYILSPFATWKIQLFDNSGDNERFLKDLEIFKYQQELKLVVGGNRSCILQRDYCGDFMVDKYYKAVN